MTTRPPIRLRIIGGQWRRRVLQAPALPGLRPTTDRLRETLFNWLMPVISGARCCDAFAGTGVLGLEALSRGAASCCFVDASSAAVCAISEHLISLSAHDKARCVTSRFEDMSFAKKSIDVLFLDPPFGKGLLEEALQQVDRLGCLSENAMVYVEYDLASRPTLPEGWFWHRDAKTKRVGYGLLVNSHHVA